MSTPAIVCTPDEIIGPAIDEFVRLRPNALKHINYGTGVYANIFAGWRAQAAVCLRRLALAAVDRRLTLATGQGLLDTVASEYDAFVELGPTTAVGDAVLVRSTSLTSGSILAGTRFKRPASLTTPIQLAAAEYITTDDVSVPIGTTTVTVPIQAVISGAASNAPWTGTSPPTGLEVADNLFDTFTSSSYTVAGGSDSVTNGDLRNFAKALVLGQYAPNIGALVAGTLKNTGVKRYGVYENPYTGVATVFVADRSWSSGSRWTAAIQQSLYDNDYVGFGCKASVGIVVNKIVSINATVMLKDGTTLSNTAAIDKAIKTAIRKYLDDRPDWYIWKTIGLKASITRADPRILKCSSVVMTDASGNPVAETSGDSLSSQFANHFFVPNNNVKLTYTAPV